MCSRLKTEYFQSSTRILILNPWRSSIVKLCVHFVAMCLKVQKWTLTDTKVTFPPTPTTHHLPTRKLFWCQMKGTAKILLFYSGAMALILTRLKDITHFVFYDCYKEAKILPLWCHSTLCLSVCPSIYCSVCLSF